MNLFLPFDVPIWYHTACSHLDSRSSRQAHKEQPAQTFVNDRSSHIIGLYVSAHRHHHGRIGHNFGKNNMNLILLVIKSALLLLSSSACEFDRVEEAARADFLRSQSQLESSRKRRLFWGSGSITKLDAHKMVWWHRNCHDGSNSEGRLLRLDLRSSLAAQLKSRPSRPAAPAAWPPRACRRC